MSEGTWRKVHIKCPYYKRDKAISITCEGFVEGSNIIQRFRTTEDCDQQARIFCCDRYDCCEIYRMLESEKYGE